MFGYNGRKWLFQQWFWLAVNDKIVHFFFTNISIFMRQHQTSVLGHIQKEFLKNITGESLQLLFRGHPPLLLGHEQLDIHIYGLGWN